MSVFLAFSASLSPFLWLAGWLADMLIFVFSAVFPPVYEIDDSTDSLEFFARSLLSYILTLTIVFVLIATVTIAWMMSIVCCTSSKPSLGVRRQQLPSRPPQHSAAQQIKCNWESSRGY